MNIGIIGSVASKFTPATQNAAEAFIQDIICDAAGLKFGESYHPATESITVVSGHCHLGGIDIWAERIARDIGAKTLIFPPQQQMWEPHGYKERNIKIAQMSDIVYVIAVKELPASYTGMRFNGCYHCDKYYGRWDAATNMRGLLSGEFEPHIKSGACWTAWYAVEKLGKQARWIIV